jgi:hypothetical protein
MGIFFPKKPRNTKLFLFKYIYFFLKKTLKFYLKILDQISQAIKYFEKYKIKIKNIYNK